MPSPVVTRFAPSPTGFLHIGGARTALFNWLYARHTGGKFLLRIEDTDRERSTEAAIAAILDGLTLARARLGRRADLPVRARSRATARSPRSCVDARQGLRCYETPRSSRRCATRRRPRAASPRYDGLWRDRDPAKRRPASRRRPLQGAARRRDGRSQDQVQGRVAFPNKELDDLIILRSDGTPTYMLAVVVDDHDMGVTHVIRGDDHLTNAARQTIIYEAMGWDVPDVRAHPADPRAGRREALQAPRRARRRGVPRHGLPARGAAQLSRAPRLVRTATTRSSPASRRSSGSTSTRINKGAGAVRLRQARSVNGHYMRADG